MGCSFSLFRHLYSPFKRCFSRRRSNVAPIYFEGPIRRQNFALPDPIMYYIAKNASTAIVHRKLVHSCKYFFIKNPVIVIPCLRYNKAGWSTCIIGKKGFEKIDMDKISTKLWLSNKFVHDCNRREESAGPLISTKLLIPKFYRVESSGISWYNLTCTLEEVVFFASRSAIKLHLQNCIVQYENGESVQLETLLAQFPLLEYLIYSCHPDGSNISTNTVKEILANPNLSKMKAFNLFEIPDTFDVEGLFEYIKSRDDLYSCLLFREDISADYQDRLEVIIDELLSTESTSYRFPLICIRNMHPDTHNALMKRFVEDCKRRNIEYSIVTL